MLIYGHVLIHIIVVAIVEAPANCINGEVRLYGSSKPNEGIL